MFIPEGGRTSYLGDVLAIVVADGRETARRGRRAVKVELRGADPVRRRRGSPRRTEHAVWGLDGNVLSLRVHNGATSRPRWPPRPHRARGLPDPAHRARLPRARVDAGRPDRRPAPRVLGWPGRVGRPRPDRRGARRREDRVTVELVSNGGAFGGKEDMANQAQTALAAWLLQRPVKCTCRREESLLIHAKRHPIRLEYWAGCDAEGRLTALQGPHGRRLGRLRLGGHEGAGAGRRPRQRARTTCPTIDVEAIAARTNNPVCGAFRGFGANQAQFAMEGVMDRLAEQVGITGWEIRERNVITPGRGVGPGPDHGRRLPGRRALPRRDPRPPYEAAVAGAGPSVWGSGLKNSGLGNGFKEIARAVVRFDDDGTVEVRHCWTEMGQGVHTVALQVAVEELGIDPGRGPGGGRHHPGARRRPDHRQSGARSWAPGRCADACRAAKADGLPPRGRLRGRVPGRLDQQARQGLSTPSSTRRSATPPSWSSPTRPPGRSSGWSPPTTSAGRSTRCCARARSRARCTWASATPCTEDFPSDDDGRPTNMTLRGLGIIRPKDMPPVDVDPGRVAPARARPTASRAWARSAWCRPPARWPPRCTHVDGGWRTRAAHAAPASRSRSTGPSRRDRRRDAGLVCAHHHLYSALARGMPAPPAAPDGFHRDPRAGLVAARRRPSTSRCIRGRRMLGALEALECGPRPSSTTTSRPTPSRAASTSSPRRAPRSGVRVVCAYGVTDRHGPDGARRGSGRERALPGRAAAGAWSASTPPSPAPTHAGGRGRAGRRPGRRRAHPRGRGPRRRRRRRAAGRAGHRRLAAGPLRAPRPRAAGHDRPQPPLQHEQRRRLRPPDAVRRTRWCSGTDGIGADMLEEFRLAYARLRESDVTAVAGDGLGLAGGGLRPGARGRRRPGDVDVRPHGALAPRLHARRAALARSWSTASSCWPTESPPGSTPTRSGPRPPSRRPASTPCCSAAEPGRPAGSSLRVTEGGERR